MIRVSATFKILCRVEHGMDYESTLRTNLDLATNFVNNFSICRKYFQIIEI